MSGENSFLDGAHSVKALDSRNKQSAFIQNSVSGFPTIPLVSFEHDQKVDQAALCQRFKDRLAHLVLLPEDFKQLLWAYSSCLQMVENNNHILAANGVDVKNDPFEATVWLFSQKKSLLSLQLPEQSSEQTLIIRFDFKNEWFKIITS